MSVAGVDLFVLAVNLPFFRLGVISRRTVPDERDIDVWTNHPFVCLGISWVQIPPPVESVY